MHDIIYEVEVVVGVMGGVLLLLWIGVTQSELKRQERETNLLSKWEP
ncbi:MAG TPA: hypothetical protein VE222_04810 [Nitrospiraceae bacterium]|jgi:hypothetical protein|nr:hypothetical protein [Nitrospiraceae bacterium]